jgi:outer membrane immunogenic protein
MKKHLLVSLAAIAVSSALSAAAADLPSRKAAPVLPPPPMWTGFYAGLNAGYSWGANTNAYSQNQGYDNYFSSPYAAPIAMNGVIPNTQSGFMGGAQLGYNYQYGPSILIGVETDIQGADVRGAGNSTGLNTASYQRTPYGVFTENTLGSTRVQGGLHYLGTIRGRLGYLFTPALLVYGTGGFAYGGSWANVSQTAIISDFNLSLGRQTGVLAGAGQQNQLLSGWTAGGGAEWMFMPDWSLKAEALYWDLNRLNVNTASYLSWGTGFGWGRTSVSYAGVQAKAGVNYHFAWGATPVVARY